MICLDTSAVIGFLNGTSATLLSRMEREAPRGRVALSTVVLCELHYGVAKSQRRRENAMRLAIFLQLPLTLLPFDPEDAAEAGLIRAELEAAGTPIGPYDLMIAAQARRRNATLVTANSGEFQCVSGLRVEDWTVIA